jgi:hypothetical protein
MVAQLLKKILLFCGNQRLILRSQGPVTTLYTEPSEPSPFPPVLRLILTLWFHLCPGLLQGTSSLQNFWLRIFTKLLTPPCVLHSLPISVILDFYQHSNSSCKTNHEIHHYTTFSGLLFASFFIDPNTLLGTLFWNILNLFYSKFHTHTKNW